MPTAESGTMVSDRVVCRGCARAEEEQAIERWAKDVPRIARHFRRLPHARLQFNLVVTKENTGWEARLTLSLDWATLAARAEAPALDAAVRKAATRMEREVTRHLASLRREALTGRLRQRRADLEAAEPGLSVDHKRSDKGAFFEALRPYLPRLRDLAHHEIRVAEIEGRVQAGEVNATDLLDEVLLRAWHRYDERPTDLSLDAWLVALLHETADEMLGAQPTTVSLDEVLPGIPEVAEEGSDVLRHPIWPITQDVTMAELLTDPSASDEEGEPFAESDEVDARILDALRNVPAHQRRAFALAAIDGWTEEEIAALLRRSPDLVRADIDAVRRRLKERWPS